MLRVRGGCLRNPVWSSPHSFPLPARTPAMTAPAFKQIQVTHHGEVAIARLLGRRLIDGAPLDELRAELLQLAERGRGVRLLLDFGAVEFLSSSMLDALGQLHRTLVASGGKLKVCHANQQIVEVLRITNLTRLFSVHDDTTEALAAF
ncbi:MAG: anti-sigma factor antagonist [Planctomycetota bacterium]|nr:MAG: anti-sigma factor antagonist [Planctomycetota bacterium]